jgi:hypothetical protein
VRRLARTPCSGLNSEESRTHLCYAADKVRSAWTYTRRNVTQNRVARSMEALDEDNMVVEHAGPMAEVDQERPGALCRAMPMRVWTLEWTLVWPARAA